VARPNFASQLTQPSGDTGLTLDIWQRVIKERYKESVIHVTSSRRIKAASSMQVCVLWWTLSGLVLIKEAVDR